MSKDLHDLHALLLSGDFYKDYDRSTELMGALRRHIAAPAGWQPIATAPKDETEIIVGFDCATVWIVHLAWWRLPDEVCEVPPEDEGWWSYVRGSVCQEKLDSWRTPTHWLPMPKRPPYGDER